MEELSISLIPQVLGRQLASEKMFFETPVSLPLDRERFHNPSELLASSGELGSWIVNKHIDRFHLPPCIKHLSFPQHVIQCQVVPKSWIEIPVPERQFILLGVVEECKEKREGEGREVPSQMDLSERIQNACLPQEF